MNIKEAKEQIKNAITAYFTKDGFGYSKVPIQKQRPVFMIGPPGIGKTAIMEQIASEIGVGLVSYSMTHHTRQSALGLPFIVREEFEGWDYQVSEYTMSEIIGAVYRLMRQTGIREGILFLDEINCVSETLAPCMLQFLQYKVFGQHRLPDGWIVVTAGNPPEYNKSVRDFDIVTWDRLKRIDVEPDYDAWKEYAYRNGVHPSIMTYLAAKKKDFYRVENTVEGMSFVTARGWDDLSQMIWLYEEKSISVDEKLISQYIHNKKIAKDFSIYYDLFNKYRSDYKVESILEGTASDSILLRAKLAKLDERLSLLGLLFDTITGEMREVLDLENVIGQLMDELKKIRSELFIEGNKAEVVLENYIAEKQASLEKSRLAQSMSVEKQRISGRVITELEGSRAEIIKENILENDAAFNVMKDRFNRSVEKLQHCSAEAGKRLENIFVFCENAFGEGQEILLLITELTANYYSSQFIGHYGSDKYFEHNKELQFHERQQDIIARMKQLNC